MKIIQIAEGLYVNIDNVFKISIVQQEKSEKCYLKFHSIGENTTAVSQVFPDMNEAKEWLSMQTMRAAATSEIVEL